MSQSNGQQPIAGYYRGQFDGELAYDGAGRNAVQLTLSSRLPDGVKHGAEDQ